MYLTEAVASSELFQWFTVPNAPWDGNIYLYIYHNNQPLHGSINIPDSSHGPAYQGVMVGLGIREKAFLGSNPYPVVFPLKKGGS